MPEALLERLRNEAQAKGGTLAAEIISRLEASFPKRFDVLVLESRQRELQAVDDQIVQFEFILEEYRSEMTANEIAEARREIERLENKKKALWEEIDELWRQQAKQESPFSQA